MAPLRSRRDASRERLQRRLDAWAVTGQDWLWEAGPDGHFTFSGSPVSPLGYSPDETAALTFDDVVHHEDRERLRRLMDAGHGWRGEIWHCIARDGSSMWLRGSAIAELGDDGRVIGYLGTCQLLSGDEELRHVRRASSGHLQEVLDREQLETVFQPIVAIETGGLLGAEALSRFPTQQRPPDEVFAGAREVGLGVELELLAVRKALAASAILPDDVYVSVNVSPHALCSPDLQGVVVRSGICPERLVLEVTEHESIDDYDVVSRALAPLRAAGIRIAVDDAGAGFASFRHILLLAPDIIKLDKTLVTGVDHDAARRTLAAAVVLLALEMGASIVAEGVETVAELRAIQLLGIDAAQGYLLGRPTNQWTSLAQWHAQGRLFRLA